MGQTHKDKCNTFSFVEGSVELTWMERQRGDRVEEPKEVDKTGVRCVVQQKSKSLPWLD